MPHQCQFKGPCPYNDWNCRECAYYLEVAYTDAELRKKIGCIISIIQPLWEMLITAFTPIFDMIDDLQKQGITMEQLQELVQGEM